MHHDPASKEILDVQATETLAEFLNILQQAAQLNVKITLSLAKSSFSVLDRFRRQRRPKYVADPMEGF